MDDFTFDVEYSEEEAIYELSVFDADDNLVAYYDDLEDVQDVVATLVSDFDVSLSEETIMEIAMLSSGSTDIDDIVDDLED